MSSVRIVLVRFLLRSMVWLKVGRNSGRLVTVLYDRRKIKYQYDQTTSIQDSASEPLNAAQKQLPYCTICDTDTFPRFPAPPKIEHFNVYICECMFLSVINHILYYYYY